MISFSLILASVCSFSWISVSLCEFLTVELQPGEEVTLMCFNLSGLVTHICWYKLAREPNATCISSMSSSVSNVTFRDGFQPDKFQMTSNTTNLFLHIKQVDLSDSGLYFCGNDKDGNLQALTATHLYVKEVFDALINLPAVILSVVTFVLIMTIISLVIRIRTSHSAQTSDLQQNQNLDSDYLNYAALRFRSKPDSSMRPELEMKVVYTAV